MATLKRIIKKEAPPLDEVCIFILLRRGIDWCINQIKIRVPLFPTTAFFSFCYSSPIFSSLALNVKKVKFKKTDVRLDFKTRI
jgi:hypothetical protein